MSFDVNSTLSGKLKLIKFDYLLKHKLNERIHEWKKIARDIKFYA